MEKNKSKDLKYQWLIDEQSIIGNCPFDGCEERKISAFRFSFKDINQEDNFLPVILFDAKQGRKPRGIKKDDLKCKSCGLSMFDTLDAAKAKFDGFPDRTKEMFAYTHIASGTFTEEDGVASSIGIDGHFTVFEYVDVDLSKSFKVVEELK